MLGVDSSRASARILVQNSPNSREITTSERVPGVSELGPWGLELPTDPRPKVSGNYDQKTRPGRVRIGPVRGPLAHPRPKFSGNYDWKARLGRVRIGSVGSGASDGSAAQILGKLRLENAPWEGQNWARGVWDFRRIRCPNPWEFTTRKPIPGGPKLATNARPMPWIRRPRHSPRNMATDWPRRARLRRGITTRKATFWGSKLASICFADGDGRRLSLCPKFSGVYD